MQDLPVSSVPQVLWVPQVSLMLPVLPQQMVEALCLELSRQEGQQLREVQMAPNQTSV